MKQKTYRILSNFLSFGGALYGSTETINLTDEQAAPLLVSKPPQIAEVPIAEAPPTGQAQI